MTASPCAPVAPMTRISFLLEAIVSGSWNEGSVLEGQRVQNIYHCQQCVNSVLTHQSPCQRGCPRGCTQESNAPRSPSYPT